MSPEELRAYRARRNYGRNALGMFVRKKAFRNCDYTNEGHLNQFVSEGAAADFEEQRYTDGQSQARYSTKVKDTVPSCRNLFCSKIGFRLVRAHVTNEPNKQ